jgi:hypothetical protein
MHYQAVRRFWRFGQQRPVNVHVALAQTESPIWHVIQRKAKDHARMKTQMAAAMREAMVETNTKLPYQPTEPVRLPKWLQERAA